ncbi:MAG: hypothetical protein WCX97_02430 [Candidatus Magasanikbacteria bacterium]
MKNPIYTWFHHHYHTRYHGIYRHAKKLFVFDLILMAVAIVMFLSGLFFIFWKPSLTDLIDLKLTIGTERIKNGELVALGITYQNRTKFDLENSVLSVQLPNGFEIDRNRTPETKFSNQSTFDLGTIKPGAKGEEIIWGYFWTELNEEARITALLSYRPEEKKNREQKMGTILITLPDSILKTELSAPFNALPGQEIPLTFTITNQTNRTIAPIDIYIPNQTSINYLKSENDWTEISFAPQETKTFTASFKLPPTPGKFNLEIATRILVKSLYNFTIAKNIAPIEIAAIPNFNLTASGAAPAYLEGGMEIPLEISWKNSGQTELKNPRLLITFNPKGVVDMLATAKSNQLIIGGENLVIDQKNRTSLSGIKPGTTDKININLVSLSKFNLNQLENAALEIKPILEGELPPVSGQKAQILGNTLSIPLATELTWGAQARYFTADGDQLGRGPLPPAVGETTKYWIFVRVINTSNAVKDAGFTAQLASGVEFTGKQSITIGAPIKYNSQTKMITWNEKNLPANSVAGLYFEVSASPTPEQIGQAITLIKNLNFTGTDDWTGKQFSLSLPAINNMLEKDDLGNEFGYEVTTITE